MSKIKLDLTPYNAMAILSFLREWINDDLVDDYKFTAIKNAVDEYEKTILANITPDQLTEVRQENEVNKLIGKSPNFKRS